MVLYLRNLVDTVANVSDEIPPCPRLDGHTEWRQYHHWLNWKLDLAPDADLEEAMKRLQDKPLANEVAKSPQHLKNYSFSVYFTENQQGHINRIHLYINEFITGIYIMHPHTHTHTHTHRHIVY